MTNSKDWIVSSSELEGKEVITRCRRFMKSVVSTGRYDDYIEIVWQYKGNEKGMPTAEEDKFLNDVIFKLSEAEEKEKTAYMVATFTGLGRMIILFYSCNIEKFAGILNDELKDLGQLPIELGSMKDVQWKEYYAILAQNGMVD